MMLRISRIFCWYNMHAFTARCSHMVENYIIFRSLNNSTVYHEVGNGDLFSFYRQARI